MSNVTEYYNTDIFSDFTGIPGSGLIGFMTGYHLHPPMVYDEKMWASGNWLEGARTSCQILGELAGLKKGDYVLDVGCGVGGPAMYIAQNFNVFVQGINISKLHIRTARNLANELNLEDRVKFLEGDAQNLNFENNCFDVVWCMNMFYHVPNKLQALNEFYRVLRPRGKLAFDDWAITENTTPEEANQLRKTWTLDKVPFEKFTELLDLMEESNFIVREIQDVSGVGKNLMSKYFKSVFEKEFRPKIELLDVWGKQCADDFLEDVMFTISLYKQNKFGYYRVIAEK